VVILVILRLLVILWILCYLVIRYSVVILLFCDYSGIRMLLDHCVVIGYSVVILLFCSYCASVWLFCDSVFAVISYDYS